MNEWFRDPEFKIAEAKAIEAERAERRHLDAQAQTLYQEAGEAFKGVAIRVPVDFPNTRSDMAIAAVACLARAGNFGEAVTFARRMLAESGGLSPHGIGELKQMAHEYAEWTAPVRQPAKRAAPRNQVRDSVRQLFKTEAA